MTNGGNGDELFPVRWIASRRTNRKSICEEMNTTSAPLGADLKTKKPEIKK